MGKSSCFHKEQLRKKKELSISHLISELVVEDVRTGAAREEAEQQLLALAVVLLAHARVVVPAVGPDVRGRRQAADPQLVEGLQRVDLEVGAVGGDAPAVAHELREVERGGAVAAHELLHLLLILSQEHEVPVEQFPLQIVSWPDRRIISKM